jgi:hypothetical protein
MNEILETIKKSGAPAFLGLGFFALVAALGFLFLQLVKLSQPVIGASLPLIIIGALALLILLLTIVTMIFWVLGLANKDQAMGLPEGSIRAVIALSLIILFTSLSVFLYKSISDGKVNTITQLSDTDRRQFIRDHATLPDIQSDISKDNDGKGIFAVGADGKPLKNADGTPQYVYDITYSSTTNVASQDFAKQLLVLLGTLMTAVTSFYLGANTVTSAVTASQTAAKVDAAIPPPTVNSIKPTSHSIANDGAVIHLEIMGANLNTVTHVKIVRAGAQQIIGTQVHSSPTSITCDIPVSTATTPPGTPWDVVVDDGGARFFTLPGALTIAA